MKLTVEINGKNCDDIELIDEGARILARNVDGVLSVLPFGALEWRNPYEDGDDYDLPLFLTLKEISDQLLTKNYEPPFYVYEFMHHHSLIYQYGLNEQKYWQVFGVTQGT